MEETMDPYGRWSSVILITGERDQAAGPKDVTIEVQQSVLVGGSKRVVMHYSDGSEQVFKVSDILIDRHFSTRRSL